MLALVLVLLTAGGAVQSGPVGDGSATLVRVANRAVHPIPVAIGAVGAPAKGVVERPLGRGEAVFLAQCAGAAGGPPPSLGVRIDDEPTVPLDTPALSFPDGPPGLWISREAHGLAALSELVVGTGAANRLVRVAPEKVPESFGALRFAPIILLDGDALDVLSVPARQALADAAAAGVSLVVGAGEGALTDEAMESISSIVVGSPTRPGSGLRTAAPRAVVQRVVEARGDAVAVVVADGKPVAAELPVGLGRVRVAGLDLATLDAGPLAERILARGPDPFGPVMAWLAGRPSLAEPRSSPFAWWVPLFTVGLVAAAGLSRRWPRVALAVVAPLFVGAVLCPPGGVATSADATSVLFVPLRGGSLIVGTLDVTLGQGGPRALPLTSGALSLDDAGPAGACLVSSASAGAFIVDGGPGERRRVTFFARSATTPKGGESTAAISEWPAGALAGAALGAISRSDVALPFDLPTRVDAWVATPLADSPVAPLVLEGAAAP